MWSCSVNDGTLENCALRALYTLQELMDVAVNAELIGRFSHNFSCR